MEITLKIQKKLKKFLDKKVEGFKYFHVAGGKLYATNSYTAITINNVNLQDGVYDKDFFMKLVNLDIVHAVAKIRKTFEKYTKVNNETKENVKSFFDELQKIGRKELRTNTKNPVIIETQYGNYCAGLMMDIADIYKDSKEVKLRVSKLFYDDNYLLIFSDGTITAMLCPFFTGNCIGYEFAEVNF